VALVYITVGTSVMFKIKSVAVHHFYAGDNIYRVKVIFLVLVSGLVIFSL